MTESGKPQRIRVGTLVLSVDEIRTDAELIVRDGVVLAVEAATGLSAAERELIAAPGLINAHAHLDLGALRGAVPPGSSFLAWVGRVVAARAEMGPEALTVGAKASADELLRTGTTTVIDIDGTGETPPSLAGHPMRIVGLRELLDGSPSSPDHRTEQAMAALASEVQAVERAAELGKNPGGLGPSAGRQEGVPSRWRGLSPHGTHTVSDALLRSAGAAVQRVPMPVAVHFVETQEESVWLKEGTGPFADWLGPSPCVTGTERLAAAGLLQSALLIHGNVPDPEEPARIAQAGAAVVHCPGSHAFFGRARFPYEAYREAGVEVLLGTDSWASNDGLDMVREMRMARQALGLSPQTAWRMATEGPAAWVPCPRVTGKLLPGSAGDMVIFRGPGGPPGPGGAPASKDIGRTLELLTTGQLEIVRVIVGGQSAF